MNKKDLNGKNKEELIRALNEKKVELLEMRFQRVSGALKNFSKLSQTRKDIAVIKTFLRQIELVG